MTDPEMRSRAAAERGPDSTTSRWNSERGLTYALKILGLVALLQYLLGKAAEFLGLVQALAAILAGAVLFAYLVFPAVARLRRRLPTGVAILTVYAAIALILGFGVAFLVPIFSDNVKSLTARLPAWTQSTQQALADPMNPFIRHLPAAVRKLLAALPGDLAALATQSVGQVASRTLAIVLAAVSATGVLVLVPVIAAYMLMEAEPLRRRFLRSFPPMLRPKVVKVLTELDAVLGGFIRGQLSVAAVIGALVTLLLLILHVPYALLIGAVAGILDIIPYVGAVAGWLPAVLIALLTNGWQNALLVTLGIATINQLEGQLVAPTLVSGSVGLTPLVTISALLAGAELWGIPGLLVAVPIAGTIRVLVDNFWPSPNSASAYESQGEGPPLVSFE